jgi:hypothetical protein
MTWIAAGATVVGAVGSAVVGANASKKASKAQQEAAARGQALAGQAYNQQQQMWAPYSQAGGAGLNMLMAGIGDGTNGDLTRRFSNADFVKDPGYDFRMQEGTKAVEGGAAARGGLLSGAAAKALTRYSQGFASNEYNNAYNRYSNDQGNRYNRLMGLTGIGQNATNNMGVATSRYGDQMVGLNSAAGNAESAGIIGQGNALQGAIGGLTSAGQYVGMQYGQGGNTGVGGSGGMTQAPIYGPNGQLESAGQYGYQGGNLAGRARRDGSPWSS